MLTILLKLILILRSLVLTPASDDKKPGVESSSLVSLKVGPEDTMRLENKAKRVGVTAFACCATAVFSIVAHGSKVLE